MMNRRQSLKAAAAGTIAAATTCVTESSRAQGPGHGPTVKLGCVCNLTNKDVFLYITSGYGVDPAFLRKDQCHYFNFYDDGKDRVLSAFVRPNELVSHFAFVPVANTCLIIEEGGREAKKRKEYEDPKADVTTTPV
jgi:hypothetical protein